MKKQKANLAVCVAALLAMAGGAPRTLHEAGSYGWLVEAALPADVLAQSKDGKLTIRLETEKGCLVVYGASFGRYPLDPTVSF